VPVVMSMAISRTTDSSSLILSPKRSIIPSPTLTQNAFLV
jgi:hypothetical protein